MGARNDWWCTEYHALFHDMRCDEHVRRVGLSTFIFLFWMVAVERIPLSATLRSRYSERGTSCGGDGKDRIVIDRVTTQFLFFQEIQHIAWHMDSTCPCAGLVGKEE